MKITDKLRQAKEKSLERACEGWQETRENLQDVQRRLRQRMRIFPRRKNNDEVVSPLAAKPAVRQEQSETTKPTYQGLQIRKSKPFFSRGKGADGGTAA